MRPRQFRDITRRFGAAVLFGLLLTSVAWGDEESERKAMFARVNESVVQVRQEHSLGSGFVVRYDKGIAIIATNYHVVEGAKQITIFFPHSDRNMKHGFPADGYIEIQPSRDLALVHVDLKDKKVAPLKIATKLPEQGDAVFTFGSPIGQHDTVAEGMVSSVRSGEEVANLMDRLGKGAYTKMMGYDINATWIQHTAAMSHGNSGGPLTNRKGEVLGLNTMNFAQEGENLNYAISAKHVKELLNGVGKNVRAWSTLPAPRDRGIMAGDGPLTLNKWKEYNRAKYTVNGKTLEIDKKMEKVPPIDKRNPMHGLTARNKKMAECYRLYSKAYGDFAAAMKTIDTKNCDPDAIMLIIVETEFAQRRTDTYRELATSMSMEDPNGEAIGRYRILELQEIAHEIQSKFDLTRTILCHKYNLDFPTVEDTMREDKEKGIKGDNAGKKADPDKLDKAEGSKVKPKPKPKPSEDPSDEGEEGFRTWSDRTGKFQIKAKYIGRAGDKVKLERPDGTVLKIPLSKLSEADQRYIKENAKSDEDSEDSEGSGE